MKREYIVTILVDPKKATEYGILDESEEVEAQIMVALQMSLHNSIIFRDMEIEVDRVEMMDENPGPIGNDVNWDDEY